MRQHLNLDSSVKYLLMFAVAVAAFGFLFISDARAQGSSTPTWRISVDVTGPNETPVYKLQSPEPKPAKERCEFDDPNPISTAENLYVCPGDQIYWVVTSNNAHVETFLYHKDAILYNEDGDIARGFHASNKDTIKGEVSGYAAPNADHKYYVVVLDRDIPKTHYGDPKIIIGTGTVDDSLNQIETRCDKLQYELRGNPNAEVQAKKLCREIRALKDRLQSK